LSPSGKRRRIKRKKDGLCEVRKRVTLLQKKRGRGGGPIYGPPSWEKEGMGKKWGIGNIQTPSITM